MLLWLHLEQTSGTAAALVRSVSAHAALGTRLHPRAAGVVALLAGGTMALSAFAGAGAGAVCPFWAKVRTEVQSGRHGEIQCGLKA